MISIPSTLLISKLTMREVPILSAIRKSKQDRQIENINIFLDMGPNLREILVLGRESTLSETIQKLSKISPA